MTPSCCCCGRSAVERCPEEYPPLRPGMALGTNNRRHQQSQSEICGGTTERARTNPNAKLQPEKATKPYQPQRFRHRQQQQRFAVNLMSFFRRHERDNVNVAGTCMVDATAQHHIFRNRRIRIDSIRSAAALSGYWCDGTLPSRNVTMLGCYYFCREKVAHLLCWLARSVRPPILKVSARCARLIKQRIIRERQIIGS